MLVLCKITNDTQNMVIIDFVCNIPLKQEICRKSVAPYDVRVLKLNFNKKIANGRQDVHIALLRKREKSDSWMFSIFVESFNYAFSYFFSSSTFIFSLRLHVEKLRNTSKNSSLMRQLSQVEAYVGLLNTDE